MSIKSSINGKKPTRPIKSVRDDRTGKDDYETKWEYVDELCDRAIESMGGDKDAMFFTQGLRDSDFAVKGHYIDIMEANGNYSFPNDLWADVCKSLGMEKLLRITEAKDRNNYTLFVDWTGNGLMNNRKPVKSSRRPIKSLNQSFFVSKELNGRTAFYCIDNSYHFENDMSRPEIKIFNNKSEAEKIAKRSKSGFAQEL